MSDEYKPRVGDLVEIVKCGCYEYGGIDPGSTCLVLKPNVEEEELADGCEEGPRLVKVDYSNALKSFTIDNPAFVEHCHTERTPKPYKLEGMIVPPCFIRPKGVRINDFIVDLHIDYGEQDTSIVVFGIDLDTGDITARCTYHDRKEAVARLSDYYE